MTNNLIIYLKYIPTYHTTTLDVVITSPTEMRYINPTAIIQLDNIVIDFEVDIRKFDVLLFPIGCNIALVSFNKRLNTTISNNGEIIVVMIKNNPTKPIEFFIKMLLDNMRSMPSDRYPPMTGI